jgi:hypothetical protein
MKRIMMPLLFTLTACGGAGTVTFTSWGEEYIEEGLPLDDTSTPGPDGFTDGWTVKYTKFVLVYKDIALAQKTGAVGPKQAGALVLDLTRPGPTTLLTFADVPAGKWDRVSYALAPDAAAVAVGAIAAADAERMRSEGLDLWLEGTGTKGAASKAFSWTFAQDTLFEDCTNPDFGEGVTVPTGGSETVQLTTHGDGEDALPGHRRRRQERRRHHDPRGARDCVADHAPRGPVRHCRRGQREDAQGLRLAADPAHRPLPGRGRLLGEGASVGRPLERASRRGAARPATPGGGAALHQSGPSSSLSFDRTSNLQPTVALR